MNDLKFRAWDKKLKLLGNVSYIDFKSKKMIYHNHNGLFNYYVNFEDVELMQSTGLFDKYGVEIYEGDIVEYLDGEYSFVGVVENSAFGIYAKNKYDNYGFEDFADENTKEAEVVVIGNIYKNKELLENE